MALEKVGVSGQARVYLPWGDPVNRKTLALALFLGYTPYMREMTRDEVLQHVHWHWEVLGEGYDGPRLIRAIGSDGVVASRVIRTWDEVRVFAEQHTEDKMVCLTVQPVKKSFAASRPSASKADIACVTTVFLDFDLADGVPLDELEDVTDIVQRKLEVYCEENGFESFVLACSGHGVHAYAPIPAIWVEECPDIDERLAAQRKEVAKLFEDDPRIRMDSVWNRNRIVKLIGLRKPPGWKANPERGPQSYFVGDAPERVEDDVLRTHLLLLRVEEESTEEAAEPEEAAEMEHEAELIEAAIAGSRYLLKLRGECSSAGDRSKAEYAFTRELWRRGHKNARAVALVRYRVQGSKSRERGFAWAMKDTKNAFTTCKEYKAGFEVGTEAGRGDKPLSESAQAFAEYAEEVTWLVPNLIAPGTKVLFAGDPKTYKSFNMLDALFQITSAGHNALYLAAEGSKADWASRLQAISESYGEIPESLRFAYKPPWIDLTDITTCLGLRREIVDFQYKAIVLDPLRFVMIGNENDSEISRAAITNMDLLANDLPPEEHPAWIMVHHLTKLQPGKVSGRPAERVRGSTNFWGAADTIVCASKEFHERHPDGTILDRARLDIEHRMAAECVLYTTIRFNPYEKTVVIKRWTKPDVTLPSMGKHSTTADKIIEVLADEVSRTEPMLHHCLAGSLQTIKEALAKLIECGIVEKDAREYVLNWPKIRRLERETVARGLVTGDVFESAIDDDEPEEVTPDPDDWQTISTVAEEPPKEPPKEQALSGSEARTVRNSRPGRPGKQIPKRLLKAYKAGEITAKKAAAAAKVSEATLFRQAKALSED